jgi:hypothetical protein
MFAVPTPEAVREQMRQNPLIFPSPFRHADIVSDVERTEYRGTESSLFLVRPGENVLLEKRGIGV